MNFLYQREIMLIIVFLGLLSFGESLRCPDGETCSDDERCCRTIFGTFECCGPRSPCISGHGCLLVEDLLSISRKMRKYVPAIRNLESCPSNHTFCPPDVCCKSPDAVCCPGLPRCCPQSTTCFPVLGLCLEVQGNPKPLTI